MDVIDTKRLLLEPLTVSRLEEFVALTGDPLTMRYWAPGGPFGRGRAESDFADSLERLREHGFGRRWIVEKETGAGVGFTDTKCFGGTFDAVAAEEIEIGWMLIPSAWGRGFGTEAALAVRDEAFQRLGLASIVAVHHPANLASQRIMEKLGMVFCCDLVAGDGWPMRLHRLDRRRWASRR